MKFHSEKELQLTLFESDLIENQIAPTFKKREVMVGNCIPDLVYLVVSQADPELSLPRNWTYYHISLISHLKKKSKMDIRSLAEETFMRPARIRKLVEDLHKAGSIEIDSNAGVSLSQGFRNLDFQVVSVEAKLTNWKQALQQGIAYQKFSNQVIVAMDAGATFPRQDALSEFILHGIGLCTVSKNDIDWLLYPQTNLDIENADRVSILASALFPSHHKLWIRL